MATIKENKLMANTTLPGRPPPEPICLTVPEHDINSPVNKSSQCRVRLTLVLDIIIILIVVTTIFVLEFGVQPFTKVGFYCKDPSISFPFKGDTIPWGLLLIGCLLLPIIVIVAVEAYRENSVYKICGSLVWKWYRECLVGINVVLVITEVGKVIIGEHRPHFLDSCAPDTGVDCVPGTFVANFECTATSNNSRYFISDSSRSFPSGHSSMSVFVSLFCASFIQQRLLNRRPVLLLKPLFIVLCLLWGLVCSLTRITDRRHHWWDVLAGSVLGISVSVYTVTVMCKKFQTPLKVSRTHHNPSASTTTLLDIKNKDATSVVI